MSEQNIRPLNDRVIVERTDSEEKTKGGIVIPDSAKEKPSRGRVISVGPGRLHPESGKRLPVEVKAGELVLFGKYAGTEVKIDDKEFVVLREEDIMGIVE